MIHIITININNYLIFTHIQKRNVKKNKYKMLCLALDAFFFLGKFSLITESGTSVFLPTDTKSRTKFLNSS